MRDDYLRGVLASEKKNLSSSEIAERDEFNRAHPPNKGLVVADDLRKMELPARPVAEQPRPLLRPRRLRGARGTHLRADARRQSVRHRHTTEAYLYVVKGHGYSLVNYDDEPIEVVEWSEGTLFAPPRWAWHQHFNLDENDTSRYLAIQDTGLLRTMRLHNIERHAVQLTPEDGAKLLREAIDSGTVHGRH